MPRVAIFDWDHTLTVRGGFLPFVGHVLRRRPRRLAAAPGVLAKAALLPLRMTERDVVKALIWRNILHGLERSAAEAIAAEWAEIWAAGALRLDALRVIADHRAAGDRLVLATAAMDIVAVPFGRVLGFDEIVATRTGWTPDGRVADAFDGPNCYGEEKLRRVRRALGPDFDPARAIAYSDHVADLPLLTWAGEGVAVNPHARLKAAAAEHGLAVADWDVAAASDSG